MTAADLSRNAHVLVLQELRSRFTYAGSPSRTAALDAAISALASQQPVMEAFQSNVAEWMGQCFLPSLSGNMTERGDRLLEEVLELLQAHGYDSARVPTLVNYVFGRPVGEPAQEVGGVMVTLAAYCSVAGLSMQADGQAELDRINQPEVMARIRVKQEAKNALHFDTPLPGAAASQPRTTLLPDDPRIVEKIAAEIEGGKLDHPGLYRNTQLAEALRRMLDAALAARPPVGQQPVELACVAETLANGVGQWRACTGCHESNEGWPTGPYSKIMRCYLGNGCNECGGIGAIWDTTDYQQMGDEMADSLAAPPAQAVDLTPVRAALDAAEGLAVVCASVDGYSREEVAASGRAMRQQFADARAMIDSQAVRNG